MSRNPKERIHHCSCENCQLSSRNTTAKQHKALNRLVASFDEKGRRLFVAYLANQYGRGGISHFAQITGLSRHTIRHGLEDLKNPADLSPYRIRQRGGGRKALEKKRSHPHQRLA